MTTPAPTPEPAPAPQPASGEPPPQPTPAEPAGPGLEAALRDERKARAELQKQLDKLQAEHMTETEKAISKARQEGAAEAAADAARKLAAAEFRFAASGRISDPAAALDLLDLTKLLDSRGEPDPKLIAAAVERLAGPKPEPAPEPAPQHARVPAGARGPVSNGSGDFIRQVIGRGQ
jgi:hypothetical protein